MGILDSSTSVYNNYQDPFATALGVGGQLGAAALGNPMLFL